MGESNCQNIQEVISILISLKQKAQVKKNIKLAVFKLINNLSGSAVVFLSYSVWTNNDAFRPM